MIDWPKELLDLGFTHCGRATFRVASFWVELDLPDSVIVFVTQARHLPTPRHLPADDHTIEIIKQLMDISRDEQVVFINSLPKL